MWSLHSSQSQESKHTKDDSAGGDAIKKLLVKQDYLVVTEVGSPLTGVAEDLSHANQTSAIPIKGDPREVGHILADT